MSTSRGNKTGREKASKTNHVQNGKTEPTQTGTKNQASSVICHEFKLAFDGHCLNLLDDQ